MNGYWLNDIDTMCLPGTPEFGKWLKEKRQAMGMSQAELGRLVGASQQKVGYWESGRSKRVHSADGRSYIQTDYPMPDWDEVRLLRQALNLDELPRIPDVNEKRYDQSLGQLEYLLDMPWTEADEKQYQRDLAELPTRTQRQRHQKFLAETADDWYADVRKHPKVYLSKPAYELLVKIRELNPYYPVDKFCTDIVNADWIYDPRSQSNNIVEDENKPTGWQAVWTVYYDGQHIGVDEYFGDDWEAVLSLLLNDGEEFDHTDDRDIVALAWRIMRLFGMEDIVANTVIPTTYGRRTHTVADYLAQEAYRYGSYPSSAMWALKKRIGFNNNWEDEYAASDVLDSWSQAVSEMEKHAWEMSESHHQLELNENLNKAYMAVCRNDDGVFENYPHGDTRELSVVNQFMEECVRKRHLDYDTLTQLVISEQRKWRQERLQEAGELLRRRIDNEVGQVMSLMTTTYGSSHSYAIP